MMGSYQRYMLNRSLELSRKAAQAVDKEADALERAAVDAELAERGAENPPYVKPFALGPDNPIVDPYSVNLELDGK